MKKVCNYRRRHAEAQLLAEGNGQKNIACAWLREEWAGPVLAALQSPLRQQKSPCTLNTHIKIFQPYSVEGCCQITASVFSNLPKELTTVPPFSLYAFVVHKYFHKLAKWVSHI